MKAELDENESPCGKLRSICYDFLVKKAFIWLFLPVLLLSLAGCGGSGGGGTTSISGKVIDGPVANASITVYQVTSAGFNKVGTGSTGSDGSFSLSIPNYNSADYYILFVSGGTFDNNGNSTGSPDMVGFLAPGGSHQVFITPITTLIGEDLFSNGVLNPNLNSAQVDAALNQMLAVLGQIFQALGGNSLNGISSSDPTGQTNLDQLLAELNGILQELANDVAGQTGEGYGQAMKDLGNYIGNNPGTFGKELGAASNGGNFSFINFNFTGGNGGTINISGTLNNNDQTDLGNLKKQPPSLGVANIPATFSVPTNFSVWVVNNSGQGTPGTVTKLDASGNKLGTYTVGNGPDSIAIDPSGNVWVAGDAVVTELDPSGNHLRTCSLNTGDGSAYMDSLDSNYVATDPSGNVWVTDIFGYTSDPLTIGSSSQYNNGYGEEGILTPTTETDWHGSVIELNPSSCAIEKTIDIHSLTNGQTDSPGPIAVDPSGNIWVISAGPLNAVNFTTNLTEVSPAGTLLQGPIQEDQLSSLAFDPAGNVWVMDNQVGAKAPAGVGEFNISTKKYSEFNAGYGPDTVAVDPSGNIWTGGEAGLSAIEWNSSGSEIKNYNIGYWAKPEQGTIAFDPSGDAWIIHDSYQGGIAGVTEINPSSGKQAVYNVADPVAIAISASASNNSGGSSGNGSGGGSAGGSSSGHQFIALAGDFSTSYILNSSDGANWNLVYDGANNSSHITGVAYGDGKWVAVGNSGSNSAILTSSDGRTWAQAYSAPNGSTPIEGIAFDNGTGTFMAIDQYASHYYVSADGSNWTAYTGNTHGGSIYGIAGAVFGKGVYVVAESGEYIDSYTLSDQTWHSFNDPQLNPHSVAYLNGLFFVSSYNGFYYSSDGVNWTLVPESNSPAGIAYGNGLYILAQGVQSPPSCNISYSTDGVHWSASGYSSTSFDCTGAYFANGVFFVTPGAAGSGPGLRSTDGKTWNSAASSNTSFYYSNIIYGNNTYVAAGNGVINYNSGIFDSTDGSTWTGILNTTSYSGMGSLSEIVYH